MHEGDGMGWLRDLMRLSSPPIEGYGELARRALSHPEWPVDTHPQARSLAALFSKLDRNVELEWLADRDSVQLCLSLVLNCPIEVVRRAAAPGREEGPGHGRVRFDDLPYARPFDLREEPLPPGIPERVLSPAAWGRLWWQAPSGSGRSLAGQWLAARGLARFLRAEHWSSVADSVPGTLPLYLELEGNGDIEGMAARLPDAAVCVAAPSPPPAGAGTGAPWTLITSPPLDSVLSRLLVWIEARLPRDGSFEAVAAETWLRPSLAAGELPTLGAVLGAAGLLDARGLREARGKSLAELAEPFVNERLARASVSGSAEAQWLKRFGFGALIQLAQNALTSSELPWTLARSQDEWIGLVPAEFVTTTAGSERAPSSTARTGSEGPRAGSSPPRAGPPAAYRIVRALIDADLLAERAPGRLAISPEFLKHAALARAREALVHQASPLDWGEALLRPHAAPGVLDALYRRFADDDFGAIQALAERDAASSPALVVASEACLVCCGLRALCGAEIPVEYLEALYNDQLDWIVQLPGKLPQPRLLCSSAPDASPIGHHAVWMLALLATSELLGERQGRAHPLLRPWGADRASATLRPMLDAIFEALADPRIAEREWAIEAFALVGRLLEPGDIADRQSSHEDELGPLPDATPPHPLARPARLAQALLDGEIDSRWLRGFGAHPLELRALSAACVLNRIAWPRMAHALWKNWQSRGCPADNDGLFAPDAAHAAEFWPHLPPEVLGTAWVRWTSAPTWPFACFGPSQWSAFVDYFADRWRRAASSSVWPAAFQHMDLAHAERALLEGQLLQTPEPMLRPLIAGVWQRFPDWLLTRMRERAASGDSVAVTRLLETAPVTLDEEIVHVLDEELSRRSTQRHVIDGARAWLFAKIAARRGDWRGAYELLVELERRLGRVERARGMPSRELEH
jgi:hypothetical protein